jgi:HTH-type transcriptional regulator / antitoxin HipB
MALFGRLMARDAEATTSAANAASARTGAAAEAPFQAAPATPKFIRPKAQQAALSDLQDMLSFDEVQGRGAGRPVSSDWLAAVPSTDILARRVRERRRKLRLSQADVAEAAKVGKRFMVDLEKGKPTLEFGKVIAVLKSLGMSLAIGLY